MKQTSKVCTCFCTQMIRESQLRSPIIATGLKYLKMYKNQLADICNRALKTECIHSNDTDVVFELLRSVLIQDKSIIQLEESWPETRLKETE